MLVKDDDIPEKKEKGTVNARNMDSSCNSLPLNGQLLNIERADSANEEESMNCNDSDGSFRTYHNKRHKVQQNGKVLSRRKLKEDLTSGAIFPRKDTDLQEIENQDLLSAKNHVVSWKIQINSEIIDLSMQLFLFIGRFNTLSWHMGNAVY